MPIKKVSISRTTTIIIDNFQITREYIHTYTHVLNTCLGTQQQIVLRDSSNSKRFSELNGSIQHRSNNKMLL